MENNRVWDGKSVGIVDLEDVNRPIAIRLNRQAARTLALTLGRLKQTTITLPGDAQELLTALDYVTIGDPNSTAQHRRMEVAKGMTPDGGYKTPEGRLERDARIGSDGMENPH